MTEIVEQPRNTSWPDMAVLAEGDLKKLLKSFGGIQTREYCGGRRMGLAGLAVGEADLCQETSLGR